MCNGNELISIMRYEMIKCINHSFSNWPGSLWEVTCFCLRWRLPTDFVSLEGPNVDGVENPRLQTNHPVRGAVTSHRDLSTGALSGRVAQHVALNFCLDSVPGNRHSVLCYFSGNQVGWSIDVWAGRDQDGWTGALATYFLSGQRFEKCLEHKQHIREMICSVECWKSLLRSVV